MLLFISMCFLDLITMESHSCSCYTSMKVLTPAQFCPPRTCGRSKTEILHMFWIKYHLDPAVNVGFGGRKCDSVCLFVTFGKCCWTQRQFL